MTKEKTREHHYGIGAAAKMTGLTDHTIRAWERRYGAVIANRAENGRREYSTSDLDKLGLLKRLTDRGVAIRLIANEDIEELRERALELEDTATFAAPSEVRVAVLGDLLPGMVSKQGVAPPPLEVVVSDFNRARFEADLNRVPVDLVILESAVLNDDTIAQVRKFMEIAGVSRGIIVYTFARRRDVEAAQLAQLLALRAPVTMEELAAGVVRTYTGDGTKQDKRRQKAPSETHDWDGDGAIAPRRFNKQQLSNLAGVTTNIDCECPRHLAQLVSDLSAFEIYSAQCANRDEEDAALHRYLHRTTAEARALIEGALEEVAVAEGLEY